MMMIGFSLPQPEKLEIKRTAMKYFCIAMNFFIGLKIPFISSSRPWNRGHKAFANFEEGLDFINRENGLFLPAQNQNIQL